MEKATFITEWFNASNSNDQSCADVRLKSDGGAQMRNSNFPDGAVLDFDAKEWSVFVAAAKAGTFDHPAA